VSDLNVVVPIISGKSWLHSHILDAHLLSSWL